MATFYTRYELELSGAEFDYSLAPYIKHTGIHWMFDDMIEYDVREHTLVAEFQFNDKNDMMVTVAMALDYNLSPSEVNLMHSKINDINLKIQTSLSAAAKVVVPQFSAVDLNKHGRTLAENMLDSLLAKELPEFYVQYKRIRITDVNIPDGISQLAEQTAVQLGRNELASKKEAEKVSLAKALVAEAQGNYEAGLLNAKTKDLMSQPKMLEMMRLENEKILAEGYNKHGRSIYGENNIFGENAGAIIKGLK
jgi:hypothetical protein